MKPVTVIAAALIVLLNAALLAPGISAYVMPVAACSLAIALILLVLLITGRSRRQNELSRTAAPPPAAPENQAQAEIVAFVGMLQDKGRIVDFLMEDIASVDDSQLAAAARVVHQGCREVLRGHFQIVPVTTASEGSPVTVPSGPDADEYRLVGKIAGSPPFTGKLVHKGWKTTTVRLPRIVRASSERLPVIAPAEVELA